MLYQRVVHLSLIVLFVFLLAAQSVIAAPSKLQEVSIKFKSTSQTVQTGNSVNLNSALTITPKVNVLYSSSNAKIAAIDSKGIIKGISKGQTVITVTVNQQGYSGKTAITVIVTDPPVKNTLGAPVTYKDLALLEKEVRSGIQTLYKKNYTNLSAAEIELQQKLLNINRNQLLTVLQQIVATANPSWAPSWVFDFERNNLENNIPAIAALFSSSSDSKNQQAVVEMLKVFDSPTAIKTLSSLLSSTTEKDLRYSLCYILSKFKNNEDALGALVSLLNREPDKSVYTNGVASALLVAGTNTEQIKTLLINYGTLAIDKKTTFTDFLYMYRTESNYMPIYTAWNAVIQNSQQSANSQEKAAAIEIWDSVKEYSPYKD